MPDILVTEELENTKTIVKFVCKTIQFFSAHLFV